MTIYQEVLNKLENFPEFRERRFHHKYICILALRANGLEDKFKENQPLNAEELRDFAVSYESYNRAWRDVLMKHEVLQGQDYNQGNSKEILEQKTMLGLGYVPDNFGQVKKLKTL